METDPDDYIMYWHLMQGNPRQPWILNSDSTAEDFMDFTSKISRILEPGLPCEGSKRRVKEK